MTTDKPICSLSLDLDNQWSYMKTHGDSGWGSFPSYLDLVVPRFLKILDDFGWKITVFVVGQDAALEKNHEALQMIADAGHEIGNHSFSHEPWLHLYSRQRVEDEIARAEEAIEYATGQHPHGFRGPGYSLSRDVLEGLTDRGYLFDASTLPTFIGPLARAYFFINSNLSAKEKSERKRLFGSLREGLQPVKPYLWEVNDKELLEIPVTTAPILKLPFHFSYILHVSTYSTTLALQYFETALRLCRMTGTDPSILLHPLDFLGGEDNSELAFFPAMKLAITHKLSILNRMFEALSCKYAVLPMRTHAARLQQAGSLRHRSMDDLGPLY